MAWTRTDNQPNAQRARDAATRHCQELADMQLLDRSMFPASSWQAWEKIAAIRVANPDLTLRELAEKVGMNKDTFAGHLRRLRLAIAHRTARQ